MTAPAVLGPTACLYDSGEESWPVKVHLGAGGVYLVDGGTGYINTDIAGTLVANAPLAWRIANQTGICDYYARLDGEAVALPKRRPTVVDLLVNCLDLPFPVESVNKILAVQMFEHLSPVEAVRALSHWQQMLAPGGVLVLTVPDMHQTLYWLEESDRDRRAFALRHLRGSQRDQYNWHLAWYTEPTLDELLDAHGFEPFQLSNPHCYPAIAVRGRKR